MFSSSGVINILDKKQKSIGTGFFVSPEGLILTCSHILQKSDYSINDQIYYRFSNGNDIYLASWIEKSEDKDDIALLKSSIIVKCYYSLSSSIGYEGLIETFGYPNGKRNGIFGRAIVYGSIKTPNNTLQTQLGNANDITHGFSGAPLIAESGNVIGVISNIPKKDESGRLANIAFAIPSSIILNIFFKYFLKTNTCNEKDNSNNTKKIVGRKEEIKYFSDYIQTNNVIVIGGMAGIGKTTLATHLYNETVNNPKIWITIREDVNNELETVLYDLCDYLTQFSYMKPINMFFDLKNSSQPYDRALNNLQNEIIIAISDLGLSVFFDDAHLLNNYQSALFFFNSLISTCKNNTFVFVTRHELSYLPSESSVLFLKGLSYQDCKTIIDKSGVILSNEQIERVYEKTQGNAKILELCIFILLETEKNNIDSAINNISSDIDIRNYIQNNIMERFSDDEIFILKIISICRKPVSFDLLLRISPKSIEPLYYSLDRLVRRNIIDKTNNETYSMHSILKGEFSRLISIESLQLHNKVAESIINDDYLEISYHYASCGRMHKALSILISRFNELISVGASAQMYKQVETYRSIVQLENISEFYYLLGCLFTVRGLYEKAIDSFNQISQNTSKELIVQSSIKLSQCYEKKGEYQKAIDVLDDLQKVVNKGDAYSKAITKINKGFLLCHIEKIYKGINMCIQGLEYLSTLPNKPLSIIADGYNDLGWNYLIKGDYKEAIFYLNKSLNLYSNNARGCALANIRLSRIYWQIGELNKGIEIINRAEELANLTGDPQLLAFSLRQKNLILWNFGEFELSLDGHKDSLRIYSSINDYWGIAASLENVAAVLYDLGQYEKALQYISNAINVCKKIESTDFLAYAFLFKARIMAKQGDIKAAKKFAKDSIKLLKKWKYSKYYLGMAKISLGLVYYFENKLMMSYLTLVLSGNDLKRGGAYYQYNISKFFRLMCLKRIRPYDKINNRINDLYKYFYSINAHKFILHLKSIESSQRRNRKCLDPSSKP